MKQKFKIIQNIQLLINIVLNIELNDGTIRINILNMKYMIMELQSRFVKSFKIRALEVARS